MTLDCRWTGDYWFILPCLSIGIADTDWNIAIGWLKGEIRLSFERRGY